MLDELFGLILTEARLKLAIDLLSLRFELSDGLVALFRLDRRALSVFALFFFAALISAHDSELHRRFSTMLARRRRHHLVDVRAKCMHSERVMARVLALPCKSVLPLGLLPENLEHCTIDD